MMYNGDPASPSRQYVACTDAEELVRFELPDTIPANNVNVAASYFRKFVNKGEIVLWIAALENVDFMSDVQNLRRVILSEGRRVETPTPPAGLIELTPQMFDFEIVKREETFPGWETAETSVEGGETPADILERWIDDVDASEIGDDMQEAGVDDVPNWNVGGFPYIPEADSDPDEEAEA